MRTVGQAAGSLYGHPGALTRAMAAPRPAAAVGPRKPALSFTTPAGLAVPRAIAVQAPRARVAPASPGVAGFTALIMAQAQRQVAANRISEIGGSPRYWRNHRQAAKACGIALP